MLWQAMLEEEDCVAVRILTVFGCDLDSLKADLSSRQEGDEAEAGKKEESTSEKNSRDLTALAKQGKLDPVIGRDRED